jgi:hypothetical protein
VSERYSTQGATTVNATNTLTTSTIREHRTLTFVGFATWLEDHPAAEGCHIELWRDAMGRMFAWTTNASGQTSVREFHNN